MAFFKFRKGGEQTPQTSNAVESVDVLRKRAKHRLMGSAILVLAGVIGFPLLFDSQPRPIAVDIPIQIPDKDSKAGAATAPAPSSAPVLPGASTVTPTEQAVAPVVAAPSPATPVKADVAKEVPAPKEEVVTPAKAEKKPVPKPAAKADASSKHNDKADKKSPADTGRFVVQVGAYTDAAKLRDVRAKLEKEGYKTYAQVVGGDAKRTRVRIGPFPNKAAAQKVADKIKKLNLPAAILEL